MKDETCTEKPDRDVKLRSVQAMRAIAALWVALFHHAPFFKLQGGAEWAYNLFNAGWTGVYIFFVLSGFIMWHLTDEQTNVRTFAISRVTRIYSTLWPAVGLFCLVAYLGQIGDPPTILGVWNSLTLLDPNPTHQTSYLYLTWTLTYELVFYMVFALVLWVGRRYALVFAVGAIVLIEGGIFVETSFGYDLPRLVSDRIAYGFLIGCAAASVAARPLPRRFEISAVILAMILFGLGTYCLGWLGKHHMALFFGGGSFAFLIGYRSLEPLLAGWSGAMLSKLGDASYAIYLIHPTIIYLTIYDNFRGHFIWRYGLWLETLFYILMVIAGSLAFYYFVERNCLKWSRTALQLERRIPA